MLAWRPGKDASPRSVLSPWLTPDGPYLGTTKWQERVAQGDVLPWDSILTFQASTPKGRIGSWILSLPLLTRPSSGKSVVQVKDGI